jgi:hypothetical protein
MATRKKTKTKSKPRAAPKKQLSLKKKTVAKKTVVKKTVAKKTVVKKKAAPKKKVKKPAPPAEVASTQQIAIAEIMGDIEERMALDRITES